MPRAANGRDLRPARVVAAPVAAAGLRRRGERQIVASLTSAERDKREHYKRRAARLAKSPAHARRKSQNTNARKDEKIFPDGQNSINVAGLGAEEHLAAIHADQFHRLLRADSFDDFQDM